MLNILKLNISKYYRQNLKLKALCKESILNVKNAQELLISETNYLPLSSLLPNKIAITKENVTSLNQKTLKHKPKIKFNNHNPWPNSTKIK